MTSWSTHDMVNYLHIFNRIKGFTAQFTALL
jgi:hypothetical protein